MRIVHTLSELSTLAGPVVLAIGVFDGVHLGHQEVINRALRDAAACEGTAAVLTFDPHPARVLRPDKAPRLLTATTHKLQLIRALGAEWLLLIHFDAAFAATEAEAFIRDLAAAAKPLHGICVGHQWRFGRCRTGNVALLERLGAEMGFRVVEVPSVRVGGETVSSTRIRRAVEAGDFALARRCLGRDYAILGTVEYGDQVGRTIGFPTANLRAHNEQFPPDGVYAVRALLEGRTRGGVANIGFRPTRSGAVSRLLEVHLFDFSEEIYGADMEITFIKHLRNERRFPNLEALKTQISADAAVARAILENEPAHTA